MVNRIDWTANDNRFLAFDARAPASCGSRFSTPDGAYSADRADLTDVLLKFAAMGQFGLPNNALCVKIQLTMRPSEGGGAGVTFRDPRGPDASSALRNGARVAAPTTADLAKMASDRPCGNSDPVGGTHDLSLIVGLA